MPSEGVEESNLLSVAIGDRRTTDPIHSLLGHLYQLIPTDCPPVLLATLHCYRDPVNDSGNVSPFVCTARVLAQSRLVQYDPDTSLRDVFEVLYPAQETNRERISGWIYEAEDNLGEYVQMLRALSLSRFEEDAFNSMMAEQEEKRVIQDLQDEQAAEDAVYSTGTAHPLSSPS